MTRAELAALVERLRAERPTWFDLEPDARATPAALDAVERALGARLPPDYAWFLAEYGGGDFAFARIYSADPDSDLYLPANQGPPPLPPGLVAFSEDGTGILFTFRVAGGAAEDDVLRFDSDDGAVEPAGTRYLDWVAREALRA